jgi:hypothetical protein
MSGTLICGRHTATDSIVPVEVNADGTLEMTAEISTAGLATEAKQDDMITHLSDIDNQTNGILTYQVQINQTQTNGNQVVKCMGNNGGNNVQLKVDANGVLETSGGGGGGDATAANQTLQLAQETVTATNSSSIDNKINQGYDATIASGGSGLQQILCYGLDIAGDLDALRVDNSGHLEVTVDDFVKGQDTMANSLPVVIASDQSAVATSSAQLPASLGQKANASSISICRSTTAGAFDLSARTTIATAGTSTKLLCDSDGKLSVNTVPDEVVISQVSQAITNGNTFTSTAVDMRGYKTISFLGSTTNNADTIKVLYSVDDITYYDSGQIITRDVTTGDFSYTATLGIRYVKLTQASTSFNSNFTITCISSKK